MKNDLRFQLINVLTTISSEYVKEKNTSYENCNRVNLNFFTRCFLLFFFSIYSRFLRHSRSECLPFYKKLLPFYTFLFLRIFPSHTLLLKKKKLYLMKVNFRIIAHFQLNVTSDLKIFINKDFIAAAIVH